MGMKCKKGSIWLQVRVQGVINSKKVEDYCFNDIMKSYCNYPFPLLLMKTILLQLRPYCFFHLQQITAYYRMHVNYFMVKD